MPERTLADFIQRRVGTIEEVATETAAPGLRLVSGAGDLLSAANIKHLQKLRVMNQVRTLDVDVVLIDLGAGTSYNILDFFLLSDVSILAVVPEPTSIENGYRFIKSALYRRLKAAASTEAARELVEAALDPRSPLGIRTPAQLLARLEPQDPDSTQAMRREVAAFQPRFVVNEVRDMADVAIGHQLVAACGRHLGVKASYAGFIHHDDAVWQAVAASAAVHVRRPHLARGGGDPAAHARSGQGGEPWHWLLSPPRAAPPLLGRAPLGLLRGPRARAEGEPRAGRAGLPVLPRALRRRGARPPYSLLEPAEGRAATAPCS